MTISNKLSVEKEHYQLKKLYQPNLEIFSFLVIARSRLPGIPVCNDDNDLLTFFKQADPTETTGKG